MKITVAISTEAAARPSAKPAMIARMQTSGARQATGQSTFNAIPTPGAVGLMVAAVMVLACRRRS